LLRDAAAIEKRFPRFAWDDNQKQKSETTTKISSTNGNNFIVLIQLPIPMRLKPIPHRAKNAALCRDNSFKKSKSNFKTKTNFKYSCKTNTGTKQHRFVRLDFR
jgi:hypothetical protein